MNSSAGNFDVIVLGGGMVGATVASLLARCAMTVAVVDHEEPAPFHGDSDVGLRVSAISPGSARILEQAGAWAGITRQRHCPYRSMQVEEAAQRGSLAWEADSFGMERLGTIVENNLLVGSLWDMLRANPMVEAFCGSAWDDLQQDEQGVCLVLEGGERLEAPLLIASDGARSQAREALGVRQEVWEYNQRGLVAVVETQQANPGIAWQRFLEGGPLAYLPLHDGRSSIVWTLPEALAKTHLEMDDAEFIPALAEAGHSWLGGPQRVGPRGAFPLTMRLSETYTVGRVAMLGDAAHAVHPLAGQGVNLGLADAAALVECLLMPGPGERMDDLARRLTQWQRWRRSESELMARGMHALHALFMAPGLSGLRGLGLRTVGRSWLARDFLIRHAAGVSRNAPRLARGEPLKKLLRAA